MSNRGRKQDTSANEEQDFEANVRECPGSIHPDIDVIKYNQFEFQQDLAPFLIPIT